ncbi:MAG: glycoside hydrolase family 3 N-terminal domain-containing protein [Porphyromonadaceae bacterium]|nr:glycoside hydrolase family 3 N-terminal domain-containing protein [Porphyromonadaceae bacterium]
MNRKIWAIFTALTILIPRLWALSPDKLPKHLFGSVDKEAMEAWADSLYQTLTLEERVAQLIMPIVYPSTDTGRIAYEARRTSKMGWGGILYQKGLLVEQVKMNDELQRVSRVPMLIALDGEWGLYMRLKDAPRYPRNMGLGLNGDNQLLYNYGREIARQCRLMGIHINFAPDVDVNINPRNPVIGTRSFGESPEDVAARALAYAAGLEDGGVLSVAKHFPGHGDTSEDSHHTLPTVSADKRRMQRVELYPFSEYIKAGHGGIMTAHLRVPAYESGALPSSLSPAITTELLKNEMKFGGLVFTDGLEMKGVHASGVKEVGVQALLAGNDILLGPIKPESMHQEVLAAVQDGRISEALLRSKVMKVLYYKWRLIKQEPKSNATMATIHKEIWSPRAEAQMREAWQASLYYLHKERATLRALQNMEYKRIAVVQIGKNPVGNVTRPTSTGGAGSRIDYFTWEAISKSPDRLNSYGLVLIQIFQTSNLPIQALTQIGVKKPLVVAYMTSPYRVNRTAQWHRTANVVLIAFEAAKEAQEAVLALLAPSIQLKSASNESQEYEDSEDPTALTGTLSQMQPTSTTPQSFSQASSIGRLNLAKLAALDQLAQEGIHKGAFPGCQIYIAHRGQVVYNKAFGTLTGGVGAKATTVNHLYDVASITKALVTSPVMMLLVAQKKVKLDGRVGHYLPELKSAPVANVRVRDLLLHQSGLPAGINFFRDLIDPNSYDGNLIRYNAFPGGIALVGKAWGNPHFRWLKEYISTKPSAQHTLPFARNLYISPTFRNRMMERLAETKLTSVGKYRYSDLNFVLLQQIAERVTGCPLDEYFDRHIARPIGAKVYYRPLDHGIPIDQIAPAQRDDFLRKQVVRGTVDDETAACLGGVGGNAGLFGAASELGRLCQLIMDRGVWQEQSIIPAGAVDQFVKTTGVGGIRALGFDKPRRRGVNPAADSASDQTIGHFGFTGTAFWIDPAEGLIFIFLSNRTYPSRQNTTLITELLRPRMHQAVYDALE